MNISPEIMNDIFDFSNNYAYELRCGNKIKKACSLTVFKRKIKKGFQRVALVDFAKHIWDKWVLYN